MNVTPGSEPLHPISPRQKWVILLATAVVLLVFFRQQVQNHFTFLSSDRYDGVIVVALLEHWFNVLKGVSDWSSPNYFFPYQKTIGYNDGYFLYGLVYSAFRAVSVDPLLATELVNMVMKAIGFVGFLYASRRLLKLPFWWSLLGAVVFSLSNNTYIQIVHAQLMSVAFVPVEALLMYEAYAALMLSQKKRFLAYGIGAALLFSSWLMTSVYTAWFFGLFTSIFICIQLIGGGRIGCRNVWKAVLANIPAVAVVIFTGMISLIPFIYAYILGHHGFRSWSEVSAYSPSIFDSINLGLNNLIFGDLISFIKGACPICDVGSGELEAGIAPMLMVLAGSGIMGLLSKKITPPPQIKMFIISLALATLITWLVSIRAGNYTAWYLIYKLWPGGTGLRVIARIFLFLSAPVTGLAIWYLSWKASVWSKYLLILLCCALVIEELNIGPTVGLDRYQELQRTISVQAPPKSCHAFYTTESPDSEGGDAASFISSSVTHNVDAMLIAEYVNLPTINGHSSFLPDDWNFAYPEKSDYSSRVMAYATRHGIEGLCRLDLTNMRWDADVNAPRLSGSLGLWDFVSAAVHNDQLEGFDNAEGFGRWSIGNHAAFRYALADRPVLPSIIRITAAAALVKGRHYQKAVISVNDGKKYEIVFYGTARRVIDLPFPPGSARHGVINFYLPNAISPKELGMNDDGRQLAIAVKSIEFR